MASSFEVAINPTTWTLSGELWAAPTQPQQQSPGDRSNTNDTNSPRPTQSGDGKHSRPSSPEGAARMEDDNPALSPTKTAATAAEIPLQKFRVAIGLRQLGLSNAEGVRAALSKEPETQGHLPSAKNPDDNSAPADAGNADSTNFNENKSPSSEPQLSTAVQRIEWMTLDLSRNFFVSLDLKDVFGPLNTRLTAYLPMSQSLLYDKLRVICFTSNDLKSMPQLPPLPLLEEYYLNHNRMVSLSLPPVETELSLGLWSVSCPNLRILELRNNALTSIVGLKDLLQAHPKLEHLSLSCNKLGRSALKDLPSCPKLKILGLFCNSLELGGDTSVEVSLRTLAERLNNLFPLLRDLYIFGNPMLAGMARNDILNIVTEAIPRLRYLDGRSPIAIGSS